MKLIDKYVSALAIFTAKSNAFYHASIQEPYSQEIMQKTNHWLCAYCLLKLSVRTTKTGYPFVDMHICLCYSNL